MLRKPAIRPSGGSVSERRMDHFPSGAPSAVRVGSGSRQCGCRRENRIASRKHQCIATALRTSLRRAINARRVHGPFRRAPAEVLPRVHQAGTVSEKRLRNRHAPHVPAGIAERSRSPQQREYRVCGRSVADRGETAQAYHFLARVGRNLTDRRRVAGGIYTEFSRHSIMDRRDDLETRRRKRKGIEHARVLVPLDDEDERSRRRVSRAAAVHDRMP